jgi:hypothetical protein
VETKGRAKAMAALQSWPGYRLAAQWIAGILMNLSIRLRLQIPGLNGGLS